jgi:hypothetical protein
VGQDEEHAGDWKDAAAYAPLLDADRSIFAWEWLRRDPGYRAAASQARGSTGLTQAMQPELWGLHVFEEPDLAAPHARPVWRADIHSYVLAAVAAGPGAPSDAFDLACFGPMAKLVLSATGREHLLISDGLRAVRIDALAGTLARGPVQLRYLLTGFASAEGPLLTLRRLLALGRTGRFARSLHPPDARGKRFVQMLRARDAIATGATQREIAAILLSPDAGQDRWRVNAPTVRSRAQRLVRAARHMASGGYLELLK